MDDRAFRAVGVLVATALGVVLLSGAGCSESIPLGGPSGDAGGGPQLPLDDGGPTPDANEFRLLCKATACPAPYGTCASDAFLCETNFHADDANCGACGVVCPQGEEVRRYFGAEWYCQSGECRMSCDASKQRADCNADAADGCETDTACDPNNCGACGRKCPEGVTCREGTCGCPAGLTDCGENTCSITRDCVVVEVDDANCGVCGRQCPTEELPPYPNTQYGCLQSECGHVKCASNYGNCNDDIERDGCESNLLEDRRNCGACGKACLDGQRCVGGKCKCAPSESECPSRWGGEPYCADFDDDPFNCGACERICPSPPDESARPVCRLGHCELDCPRGYADCDGRVDNGCETFVSADPQNCGGCGVHCDLALGQPCVNGACLMAPCEPGETQ